MTAAQLARVDRAIREEPYPHTLEEIGAMMGITRERVRQLQNRALKKLRVRCLVEGISWKDFCHAAGKPDFEAPGTHEQHRLARRYWDNMIKKKKGKR